MVYWNKERLVGIEKREWYNKMNREPCIKETREDKTTNIRKIMGQMIANDKLLANKGNAKPTIIVPILGQCQCGAIIELQ